MKRPATGQATVLACFVLVASSVQSQQQAVLADNVILPSYGKQLSLQGLNGQVGLQSSNQLLVGKHR